MLGITCHIWSIKSLYRKRAFFDTNFLGPSEDNAQVIVSQIIVQSSTSFSKEFKRTKRTYTLTFQFLSGFICPLCLLGSKAHLV